SYKTNTFIQKKVASTLSNLEKFGDPYRYNLWRAHLLIFKDHPVTGLGYYVATDAKFLEPYYKKLKTIERETYRGLTHAHNNYIDVLSGTGLIGFISFMLFFIMLIKHILISRKIAIQKKLEYEQLLAVGLLGAIASLMMNMVMDTSLQMIKVCYPFIFICGLSIYLNEYLREKRSL
ncbi:MAG TPA: O-antigen ligase family protein, partial [bacterium]|nr:O-antigen ligase family protein [bacterium]